MSKKLWLGVCAVSLALLLAGCSSGQASSASSPSSGQTQQGAADQNANTHGKMSTQQRQQFQQELRAGKVVSFTSTTVTIDVQRGGADVGTTATYKLTSSTRVRKDRSTVSTNGQVPNLSSLGLKSGYYAVLMVKNGNVIDIQFNSDGSQPQGPAHNGNGSPPNQNGSPPNQ